MDLLHNWSLNGRAAVRGVMTDIDDTLTTDGTVHQTTLDALHALRASGFALIAITGRPAGWCAGFATDWPLDALVAENGALAYVRMPGDAGVDKIHQQSESLRVQQFARMAAVAQRILREVPGARLATDSAGRECDIAIDHSEHSRLDSAQIEQVLGLMRAAGMNATVSSIHINGWYGAHDKWQAANWIVTHRYGRRLCDELEQWVYIGDSSNDERMFEHFVHSVGVANLARFAPAMRHLPRYVTPSERGAGFAELAAALLQARHHRQTAAPS